MARRNQPAAKTPVYTRPYWFDRARSLCELHGWPRAAVGPDAVGLIGRHGNAVDRPVGRLDADELVMLLTQGTDPHYLVPVALELLRTRADERLLLHLLRLPEAFWRAHPCLRGELLAFVTDVAATDEALARAVGSFVERARTRR